MTEQELKEKIIKIVYKTIVFQETKNLFGANYQVLSENIADALIAAEIGDVSEWKQRAEVAERALDLCETAYVLAINGMKTHGISLQAITSNLGVHGFFMRQAENELQEERKDDNK